MNKLKIIILFCIITLLSGCSVQYNLKINEDNTINESVVATEKTRRMESYTRLKDRQAVMYLYNMFKRKNENININYINEDTNTIATAFTSHNDINDYANKFKSDVFESINIEKNGGVITFTANQSKLLGENSGYTLVYDDITINIEIPYEVTYNNADSNSESVYTWNIGKNNNLKTIKFSYKEGSIKEKINVKINDKVYNINYGLIAIGSLITIILLIVIFVYIKNKKNNIV
ncbi:MAG: hypothetical protein J6B64_00240 [Bacilli bacterium]|nr:hypothetical protein [Bacilli bacterium]MBP3635560.1 hypothetical protein [Bacilli bacterium]